MLTFAVNSPNNCDWMVNITEKCKCLDVIWIFIFILGTRRSSLDLSLTIMTNAYQRLTMLANALQIRNERCARRDWAYQQFQTNEAIASECYECLRILTNRLTNVNNALRNVTNVLPSLPMSCLFLLLFPNNGLRGRDCYKYRGESRSGHLFDLTNSNTTFVRKGTREGYKR